MVHDYSLHTWGFDVCSHSFIRFQVPSPSAAEMITYPITTNKRVVIDNNLFIQYPIAITRSKTPVCDFIYRDKAGAKFYTGLSAAQRKCLWDFLGPAKYRLQGVQFVIGHSLLFIG